MQNEWTVEVDITRDNVIEIPCEEGEIVAGDRLRVRVIIEEVLVDGEAEQLNAWVEQLNRERAEHPEDYESVPLQEILAEREAAALRDNVPEEQRRAA